MARNLICSLLSRPHACCSHAYALKWQWCAGVVCCQSNGLGYVKLEAGITQSVTCPTTYAVIGLYYTSMQLAGTLLDDASVWISLNTLQFLIMAGKQLPGLPESGLCTLMMAGAWSMLMLVESRLCMRVDPDVSDVCLAPARHLHQGSQKHKFGPVRLSDCVCPSDEVLSCSE